MNSLNRTTITISDYCKLVDERDKAVKEQRALFLQLFDKYETLLSKRLGYKSSALAVTPEEHEARRAYEAAIGECTRLENSVDIRFYNITYPHLAAA